MFRTQTGHNTMIIVKGEAYFTIIDAAKTLGVSTKAVRGYIEKGIIPAPPSFGTGSARSNTFLRNI